MQRALRTVSIESTLNRSCWRLNAGVNDEVNDDVNAGVNGADALRVPLFDLPMMAPALQVLAGTTAPRIVDVDIDRYDIDGTVRPIFLVARSASRADLPQAGWVQEHLVDTHGDAGLPYRRSTSERVGALVRCGVGASARGRRRCVGSGDHVAECERIQRPIQAINAQHALLQPDVAGPVLGQLGHRMVDQLDVRCNGGGNPKVQARPYA
jgi:hypothetical protein